MKKVCFLIPCKLSFLHLFYDNDISVCTPVSGYFFLQSIIESIQVVGEIDSIAYTCITWMVKALIDLGRPQAIVGLYAWVKKVYRGRHVWIKYAAQMAEGR